MKKTQSKNTKPYTPPKKILERYADVLVNYSLGDGKPFKKGHTVLINCPESAKPLFLEIRKAVWKAGGHVLYNYRPDEDGRFNDSSDFYTHACGHQITHFPKTYVTGMINEIDYTITLLADANPHGLSHVDPQLIMKRGASYAEPFRSLLFDKVYAGKLNWNLALYGTEAMAKEAGLSLRDYWQQIIKACFLNETDPIKKWKEVRKDIKTYITKLNKLDIAKMHIEGPDADLWIGLGDKRAWKGGDGNNTPTFEIFTSPDWRETEGWIRFNQPLYCNGNRIENIRLEFSKGKVVKATAKKGQKFLTELIASKNGDKIGEFSLTDRRFSKITKFMANTLFDENVGGRYGNTHIAIGTAYKDCYTGDFTKTSDAEYKKLGYNDSPIHVDIISTTDRTVTAFLKNGKEKVIYKKGEFVI